MNERIKQLWLDKLKTAKQTTGRLCNTITNEYCCLGVLTQCYLDEHNLSWGHTETNSYGIYEEYGVLPQCVRTWAELDTDNPVNLAVLNDEGYTFAQIAEYIEQL